jgi:hypothetical protein
LPITLDQFKKAQTPAPAEIPSWAKTETTQLLYSSTIKHYQLIKSKIESGNSKLPPTDRILIARRIALDCGLSPSIISTRRQAEIVNLITELNEELSTIYTSTAAVKTPSGRKLTKKELIAENASLKAEITRLKTLELGAYAHTILDSHLTPTSRAQAITIAKLRTEIERLEVVISNQADQNRKYMDALNHTKGDI